MGAERRGGQLGGRGACGHCTEGLRGPGARPAGHSLRGLDKHGLAAPATPKATQSRASSAHSAASEHTHLIDQHEHQSILVINQVLNLLEHPSHQLATLEVKHSSLSARVLQAAWCTHASSLHLAALTPGAPTSPPSPDCPLENSLNQRSRSAGNLEACPPGVMGRAMRAPQPLSPLSCPGGPGWAGSRVQIGQANLDRHSCPHPPSARGTVRHGACSRAFQNRGAAVTSPSLSASVHSWQTRLKLRVQSHQKVTPPSSGNTECPMPQPGSGGDKQRVLSGLRWFPGYH